jgi:hypothetical protein
MLISGRTVRTLGLRPDARPRRAAWARAAASYGDGSAGRGGRGELRRPGVADAAEYIDGAEYWDERELGARDGALPRSLRS